ncbi:Guanylate kinase [Aphelenchoides besseyi]|nr:Guanylate kinase [Aphelenchoides besseyi]KAI6222093.1 Guanylate kinase [Aphelenchoides besseyi]
MRLPSIARGLAFAMSAIQPIVLTGPSGTGKSTILTRAMKDYPDKFAFSVSHTTRSPRKGEIDGIHYFFVTRDQIEEMIKNNEFVEFAEFGGNIYGTSRKAIEDIQHSGRICILDVELQGVRNLKRQGLKAKYILIRAPSLDVLKERLLKRGTETEETIALRLKHAREDDEAAEKESDLFDDVIVNDELDKAYQEFKGAIDLKPDVENHANGQNGV